MFMQFACYFGWHPSSIVRDQIVCDEQTKTINELHVIIKCRYCGKLIEEAHAYKGVDF